MNEEKNGGTSSLTPLANPVEAGRIGGRRSGAIRRERSRRRYVALILGVTPRQLDRLRRRGVVSLRAEDVRDYLVKDIEARVRREAQMRTIPGGRSWPPDQRLVDRRPDPLGGRV